MTKHKKSLKRTTNKLLITKKKNLPLIARLKLLFSSIYFWISFISIILGLIITYYSFLTKIRITPDIYLNPKDPSSVSFLFENESIFPVYNFEYEFWIREVDFDNDVNISFLSTKSNEPPIDILKPSQSFSDFIVFPFEIISPENNKTPIWRSADIDIEVTYIPKFVFWRETISKRFVGKRDAFGNLKWISAKPLNDTPPKDKRTRFVYTGKRKY